MHVWILPEDSLTLFLVDVTQVSFQVIWILFEIYMLLMFYFHILVIRSTHSKITKITVVPFLMRKDKNSLFFTSDRS